MESRAKTIFCDIDGTLVKHKKPIDSTSEDTELELLEGTLEKILEWDKKGYNIILVTGRRESTRESTKKQLSKIGIIYDQLIMGIGGGVRVVINDCKPDGEETAKSITTIRDYGIKDINL
jgi:ribonucleotide monophosphatase NagD (HAD superfamily)